MSGPDDKGTITVKFGDKFDAPWYVAYGAPSELRRQLVEFAGIEDDPEMSLQTLVVMVASGAQAEWAIRSKLGGTPAPTEAKFERAVDKVKKSAEKEPAEDPHAFIYALIAEATDNKGLMRTFMANKDAFSTDKGLQAAFNERKNAFS